MKRTLAEHVAFLMLSAALAVGAWAVTGRAACSVTAPYQFPVQPGTPEWVELSANARRAACRLPAGLAEQMTSEALLETALDYPFNASMYVSSDLEGMFGKRAALAGNDALAELVTRPDAEEVIARALAANPKFILLDEPFAGVDPISVIDIKRIIEHLRDSGLGVLITDHNVRETLAVCERAYIVSQGNLIAHGTPQQILEDDHVKRVYLGEDFRL